MPAAVAIDSARALMQRVPNLRSVAHDGTSPQRASVHFVVPSRPTRTIGFISVGRTSGLAAKSGTLGTLKCALIADGFSERS